MAALPTAAAAQLAGLSLLGLLGLLPPGSAAPEGSGLALDEMGRWEGELGFCRMERRAPPGKPEGALQRLECRRLRIDQQVPGLLSVRFLEAEPPGARPAVLLVFAGVLQAESRPMDCPQLRCRPHWPIHLEVRVLAHRGLDPGPLRSNLLAAQLGRGRCDLASRRFSCRARGADGEEWLVEAGPERHGK
jgi:hypothetical protein